MLQYTNAPIGVVIASVTNSVAGTNVPASAVAPSALATGAVGYLVNGLTVTDNLGDIITTAEDGMFVWKDRNGKLHFTDIIDISELTTTDTNQLAINTPYLAPAAQVSYIGHNGTTGSINVLDSEPYEMILYIRNSSIMGGHLSNAYPKHVGGFTTSANATQEEIALAMAYSGYKNFKEEKVMKLQFDAITSATGVATSAGVLSVVRGSNVVTWVEDGNNNDAGKYDTDGSSVAVGDYIRIGANTVVTSVYKVTAVNGAATSTIYLTLDRPFTGTTNASVAAASTFIIPSATGLAGNWGVRIVSLELFATTYGIETTNYWTLDGRMQFDVNSFTVAYYSGFNAADTIITYTTAASRGNGSYWEVAEREYFTQGFDGNQIYTGYPAFITRSNAVPGYTYDKYYFRWADVGSTSNVLGTTLKQFKEIEVYVPSLDTTSTNSMDLAF